MMRHQCIICFVAITVIDIKSYTKTNLGYKQLDEKYFL